LKLGGYTNINGACGRSMKNTSIIFLEGLAKATNWKEYINYNSAPKRGDQITFYRIVVVYRRPSVLQTTLENFTINLNNFQNFPYGLTKCSNSVFSFNINMPIDMISPSNVYRICIVGENC
jgi:hypothetical protein